MTGPTTKPVARGEIRLIPPIPPQWPHAPGQKSTDNTPVHICVLDSSFNPPTLTHGIIAVSSFPEASTATASADNDSISDHYTARLLLFSSSNVDKTPSPGDPSLNQRLELVSLLAAHVAQTGQPTAVGLIDEPMFVGKSKLLHSFFSDMDVRPKLSFMVGTDTLTRCFDPRYFGAMEGGINQALTDFFDKEGSTMVCARRAGEDKVEKALMGREEVRFRVNKDQIRFIGSGLEDWAGMSSTQVREAIREGQWDKVRAMVIPDIMEYVQKEGLYTTS